MNYRDKALIRISCFVVISLVTVFAVSNLTPVFAQEIFSGRSITLSVRKPSPEGFSLVFIATDPMGNVLHISPFLENTNTYILPLVLDPGDYSVLAAIIDPSEYQTFKEILQGANINDQNIKNTLEQGIREGSWSRFVSKGFSVVPVEEDADVCPNNIEGVQTSIPEFLVFDAEGNCVCPKSAERLPAQTGSEG